jgi:hypothetical protein
LAAHRASDEINLGEELKLITDIFKNDWFPVQEALGLRDTLVVAIKAAKDAWHNAGCPGLLSSESESSSDDAEERHCLERVRGRKDHVQIDDWIIKANGGTGLATVMSTYGLPYGKEAYFEVHVLGSSCDGLQIGLLTDGFVGVNEATTHGLGHDRCSIGASGLTTWSNSIMKRCINGQVWGKKKSTMKVGVLCDLRSGDKDEPKVVFSTTGNTSDLESCIVMPVPSEWIRPDQDKKSRIFPAVSLNKGRIQMVLKKNDFYHAPPIAAISLFQEDEVHFEEKFMHKCHLVYVDDLWFMLAGSFSACSEICFQGK